MKDWIEIFALAIALVAICVFMVFAFEWAWNYVMPDTFGVHTVTFWRAAALIFLLGFVGFGSSFGKNKKS